MAKLSSQDLAALGDLQAAYSAWAIAAYRPAEAKGTIADAAQALESAKSRFLSAKIDHVAVIRYFHRERLLNTVGVVALADLPQHALQELLPELVSISCVTRLAALGRRLICSLPRDWVLAHIEEVAEPIVVAGDDDDFRRLLELYIQLDQELTRRLAERAVASRIPEIREVGDAFMDMLGA